MPLQWPLNNGALAPRCRCWSTNSHGTSRAIGTSPMNFRLLTPLYSAFAVASVLLCSHAEANPTVIVSVPDQKLVVLQNGLRVAQYPVSTSKFGLGDRNRSFATPLGSLAIASKVGGGAPLGAVFKSRRFTGEVLKPNAPGRDPIVTRILRLKGLESQNAKAFSRGIYIHGTPQEKLIGRPASFGCIRMRSKDVVRVFDTLPVGTRVEIVNAPLSRAMNEIAQHRRIIDKAS